MTLGYSMILGSSTTNLGLAMTNLCLATTNLCLATTNLGPGLATTLGFATMLRLATLTLDPAMIPQLSPLLSSVLPLSTLVL